MEWQGMSCGDRWNLQPCLSQSHIKGNKMLKAEKWNSGFSSDGKLLCFHKTLKRILLGGVDPCIRPQVWEFLLGCYAVETTSEYRRRLRKARRERYSELIKQCGRMHSSIGTGRLAHVVGAKVMDMRPPTKDCVSSSQQPDSSFDFPPLPVSHLFHKDTRGGRHKFRFQDHQMHNFQIANNDELLIESPEIQVDRGDALHIRNKKQIVNRMRISDVPDAEFVDGMLPQPEAVTTDQVSEWLWTLHRIVVDVVRTDTHLEFYEDTRNLARMSDILAVYAWVDPATGYCQGMSDLLSPFIVLFEDDADAFWCFEMLLRRTRENFNIEGPIGVMKQLQQLSSILELTDKEMYDHLSNIGADSLHFAFRMLLVLFRRELPFHEALSMWEMMWAADFDESAIDGLEKNCLETLKVRIKRDAETESAEKETISNNETGMKSGTTHFCGWTANLLSREDPTGICSSVDDELPVFCVAAILTINRNKILRETRSIDDTIKIFNDKILRINAKRCVRAAIKIRKKYLYKFQVMKRKDSNGE